LCRWMILVSIIHPLGLVNQCEVKTNVIGANTRPRMGFNIRSEQVGEFTCILKGVPPFKSCLWPSHAMLQQGQDAGML
jgi:hypothetical protein